MTWDLIQNIAIVVLVIWNLTIISDANRAFRTVNRSIRRSRRFR